MNNNLAIGTNLPLQAETQAQVQGQAAKAADQKKAAEFGGAMALAAQLQALQTAPGQPAPQSQAAPASVLGQQPGMETVQAAQLDLAQLQTQYGSSGVLGVIGQTKSEGKNASLNTLAGLNTDSTQAGPAMMIPQGMIPIEPVQLGLSPQAGEASSLKGSLTNEQPTEGDLAWLLTANQAGLASSGLDPETGARGKLVTAPQGGAANLGGAEFLSMRTGQGQSQPQMQFGGGGGSNGGGQPPTFGETLKIGDQAGAKLKNLRPQDSGEALFQTGYASKTLTPTAAGSITGHVVSGAMAQGRLSSESLRDISSQIRTIGASAKPGPNGITGLGAGEFKVRLKPDHLGELHLKIVTQGNQVGIQIQASDENAKRILEESLGSLKDSLAAQSLTLGKMDVSVVQATGSGMGSGSMNFSSSDQNMFRGDMMAQAWNQSGSGLDSRQGSQQGGQSFESERAYGNSSGRANPMGQVGLTQAARGMNSGNSGRLDVRG